MTAQLAPRSAGAVTRGRLTDVERAERKVTGTELQRQITDLAELLGWDWLEVGALRTKYGWKTPTRGTLGEGWPDLTLIRRRDRRIVFAEVKRQLEEPRQSQLDVLEVLGALTGEPQPTPFPGTWARVEVYVWRPSDLRDPIESSRIYEVLR